MTDTVTKTQASRRGKRSLMSWHDPAVIRHLRVLAAEQDRTLQALVGEALADLFVKHGRQIA
jgi:hypothetical protein